jgi:hypothetical protein
MVKNIFDKKVTDEVIARINNLKKDTAPQWGKMDVAKMLAHCCVTYEMIYENKHPKPNFFVRLMLKLFVKNMVVSDKPYQKNGQTAPAFIIKSDKDFETEKKRLTDYILKTQELGGSYFEGKESNSFGKLTAKEWSNLFYKHLDHHLTQFGV